MMISAKHFPLARPIPAGRKPYGFSLSRKFSWENVRKLQHRVASFAEAPDDIGDTLIVEGEEEQTLEMRMQKGLSRVNEVRGDKYRSFFFPEEGIQAYISETDGGHLNISQTYLHEDESGVVAKPELEGEIPDEPLSYTVLEWDDWISGDVMNDEEESRALKKIYFLKQIDDYAGTPDLSTIYCLDPKERMVLQCKIEDKSNGSDEPVMRIREDGIVIEDALTAPKPKDIAEQHEYNAMIQQEIDLVDQEDLLKRWRELPDDFQGSLEGLFQEQSTAEEEQRKQASGKSAEGDVEYDEGLDETPDVPEIDMM